MSKLFEPFNLGSMTLANRIVMAPMTRTRTVGDLADDLTALYYAQRATAGLIITEGMPISEEARGYLYTPGLYTDAQTLAWKKVTRAVHEKGGKIFAQLWHVGRLSHVSLQPNNEAPVSSGPTQATNTTVYAWQKPGQEGPVAPSAPRALTTVEIQRVIQDFVASAQRAMAAGFDGVEIMAANAFLFDQFLSSSLNQRQDKYGGSIENRQRLLLETIDALAEAIGADKVGVRVSPFGRLYDMQAFEGEAQAWVSLAKALNERPIAYVHVNYQPTIESAPVPEGFTAAFRQNFSGVLIGAGGFTKEIAEAQIQAGFHDLAAFGTPYISNPDLVERMKNSWPLTSPDRSTFYGVIGAKGYTDYSVYKDN